MRTSFTLSLYAETHRNKKKKKCFPASSSLAARILSLVLVFLEGHTFYLWPSKYHLKLRPLLTLPAPIQHPPGDPDHSTECLLSFPSACPLPPSLEESGHFCYAVSFVLGGRLSETPSWASHVSLPHLAGQVHLPVTPSHCQSGSRCVCSPEEGACWCSPRPPRLLALCLGHHRPVPYNLQSGQADWAAATELSQAKEQKEGFHGGFREASVCQQAGSWGFRTNPGALPGGVLKGFIYMLEPAEGLRKDMGWFLFWSPKSPCKHQSWKSKQVMTLAPKKSAKVNAA